MAGDENDDSTVHSRHSDSVPEDMPSAASRAAGRFTSSTEFSSLLSASSSLQSVPNKHILIQLVMGGWWMMAWVSNRARPCDCCIILKSGSYTNAV